MAESIDYKRPVSLSLPQSMLQSIDEKRGRLPRSTFILAILEQTLGKGRKNKGAQRFRLSHTSQAEKLT